MSSVLLQMAASMTNSSVGGGAIAKTIKLALSQLQGPSRGALYAFQRDRAFLVHFEVKNTHNYIHRRNDRW